MTSARPRVDEAPSRVLARIEEELREVWSAPTPPGEAPKSRVCTINLVVVAGSADVATRMIPVLDEVTTNIPARAVVVTLEPNATEHRLEGSVTAICAPVHGGGEGAICSERITLVAAGNVCARVGSAVEALLVSDIPTSLVWLERVHGGDPVFHALASHAQRVVVDSEHTSLTSLTHVARWARSGAGRPHVADLAWTRLAIWQEMCARFFDEPRLREHAHQITSVTVGQVAERGAALGSEAVLLLSWMATRLGWTATRIGGTLKLHRQDKKPIRLLLEAVGRAPHVTSTALARVGIEAEREGLALRGSIERNLGSGEEDADVVAWRLSVGDREPKGNGYVLEQSIRLSANQEAKVLERTLHRPWTDPALNETLAFAEEVFEDGIPCG